MFNKFTLCAAAICLASDASAAVVAGLSDVTDNGGGSYTFVFDSVKSDIDGTGMGLGFFGGGISIVATSAQGRVRQDYPANGGLGVLGNTGTDNLELELGETLTLTFSRAVEIVNWTFNGLRANDGHQDAADGSFFAGGDFGGHGDSADRFDGVGSDLVPDAFSSMCNLNPTFCSTSTFMISKNGGDAFKGYLESITIKVAAVPVPAALPLMLGALGGLGFAARRRRKG